MENLNLNKLLEREQAFVRIKNTLLNFEQNKKNLVIKRGIYIYGPPGTGKTMFIMQLLKELNYDIIKYDAGDIRNKSIIEMITKYNMSDTNVMSLFHKKAQKIAIVMDEIDGMNNGDKGGINSLIKLIRPKKTKKQRLEDITMNPIICIGNYHIDKKIKELMKVCELVELKPSSDGQMLNILSTMLPMIDKPLVNNLVQFIQGDLRKLNSIYEIYNNQQNILKSEIIQNIFQQKSYNEDTKQITQNLINTKYTLHEHLNIMNETDRTIVGLLWHENIIDVLGKIKKSTSIPFYCDILNNICFADYIDRITFQKQIWQFNEMSSLIKTMHNNQLYHDSAIKKNKYNPPEVRFTKVLTKYSTEYNNSLFVQSLCQQLNMDQKDMFLFFLDLRNKSPEDEIYSMFEHYDINKLDINRIYRYIDKYTKITDTIDDEPIVDTNTIVDESDEI